MEKSSTAGTMQGSILERMNLHNTTEFNELLRQRVLCGWDFSPSHIEAWRASADSKALSLFWIVPESQSKIPAPERYTGHIGMLGKTEPADDNPTGATRPVQHICNLFILPEHRRGGLGKAAVVALEAWAKVEPYGSPDCKAITLNALSRRYVEDDAEEWRGFYKKLCHTLGIEQPAKGSSNEDWYTRMGYVKWKEEPLYPVEFEGEKILLLAAWLRKELD